MCSFELQRELLPKKLLWNKTYLYVLQGFLTLYVLLKTNTYKVKKTLQDKDTKDKFMFIYYLKLGFLHVIPLGFDHILFILSLFFYNSNLKTAIVQCSIFTLAHSITLGLASAGVLTLNSQFIEVIIALSIFAVSFNTIFQINLKFWRLGFIFIFGLVHGLGFATALKNIGLPKNDFYTALISFNIGVELAQIAIITVCYFLIAKQFKHKTWYQFKLVNPISFAICCIALFWTMQRILNN